MELENYFLENEIKNVKNFLIYFHDRFLLDKRIKDPQAILLSIYMLNNKTKKSFISEKEVKSLFLKMGRINKDFTKSKYDILGKRKNSTALIFCENDSLGLSFEGLRKIKNIIGGEKDE